MSVAVASAFRGMAAMTPRFFLARLGRVLARGNPDGHRLLGYAGTSSPASSPDVVGDVGGSAGGEHPVRADERHHAVAEAADGGFDQSVAGDASRLEGGCRVGVGGHQYVAAAAQQLVQPSGPVRRVEQDVMDTLARPRATSPGTPIALGVAQDERARRVADRTWDSRRAAPRCTAGRRATSGSTVSRTARFSGFRIVSRPTSLFGEPEHPGRNGHAFLSVAVEQAIRGAAAGDEGQLPCQVAGVHHPGVHALTAGRRVDVGGVAGERGRRPRRYVVVERSWHRKDASHRGSETLTGQGARCPTRSWISSRVGARPPRSPALAMTTRQRCPPMGMQTSGSPSGLKNRCTASSLPAPSSATSASSQSCGYGCPSNANPSSWRTRLCAPSQPTTYPVRDVHLAARGVAQRGVDGVAALGRGSASSTLCSIVPPSSCTRARSNSSVSRCGRCSTKPYREPLRARFRSSRLPGAGVHAESGGPMAVLDERVRQPHGVEQLEGARVDPSARLCGAGPSLLSMTRVPDAASEQLGGERQAGRPGADDQHLAVSGRCVRGHGGKAGPARRRSIEKNYVAAT